MSGDLTPSRRYVRARGEAGRYVAVASARTNMVQADMQAIASAAEFGMFQVMHVKRMQGELEKLCPDATEALALIANTASLAIAQRVQQFGAEQGWS